MSRRENLEAALTHFRRYLEVRGFRVSILASRHLRNYLMKVERREEILSELRREERTFENLIEGFSKLAQSSSKIALSHDRRTITADDINEAIELLFCSVWPFCK